MLAGLRIQKERCKTLLTPEDQPDTAALVSEGLEDPQPEKAPTDIKTKTTKVAVVFGSLRKTKHVNSAMKTKVSGSRSLDRIT